jgi:hypothetical protein
MSEFEALLLSAAIEAPIAWLIVRWRAWPCRGARHAALAAAFATTCTHPQLWAGVNAFAPAIGYVPAVALGEAAVVLAEAGIFVWVITLSPVRALLLSLATNTASFAFGLVLAALA